MTPTEQAIQLAGELQAVKDDLKVLTYTETEEGRKLWALFSIEIDHLIEDEYRLLEAQYNNELAHAACNKAVMSLYRIKQLPKILTNSASAKLEDIGAKLNAAKSAQSRFEQDQEATSKFDPGIETDKETQI